MHSKELARQQALERYRVLDTNPESAFDELVRLAAMMCRTPISLIGLTDHNRHWFKARIGLTDSEVPRNIAFCNVAVEQQAPLEVPDTRLDARFANNPLVTAEEGVRFYAGVPLRTSDNHCIGTICVMDTVPRELTDAQRQTLATIAEQVMAQLELRLRPELPETSQTRRLNAAVPLDQFSTTVAHELKSPLASLLALADLMLGDARQGDGKAVCEALTVMGGEVSRLQKLVGDLLDFAHNTWDTDDAGAAATSTEA